MTQIIALLTGLLWTCNAFGQTYATRNGERGTSIVVPDTIAKMLPKLAPGADSINWELRSYKREEYYEVYFRQGGQEGWMTFEPNG